MFGTCIQEWNIHGNKADYRNLRASDLSYSHDDKFLTTSSPDSEVPFYTIPKSTAGFAPGTLDTGRGATNCVDWHPSIPRLITGGADNIIKIWNLKPI